MCHVSVGIAWSIGWNQRRMAIASSTIYTAGRKAGVRDPYSSMLALLIQVM